MHACIGALPPCEGGPKASASPRLTERAVTDDIRTSAQLACKACARQQRRVTDNEHVHAGVALPLAVTLQQLCLRAPRRSRAALSVLACIMFFLALICLGNPPSQPHPFWAPLEPTRTWDRCHLSSSAIPSQPCSQSISPKHFGWKLCQV